MVNLRKNNGSKTYSGIKTEYINQKEQFEQEYVNKPAVLHKGTVCGEPTPIVAFETGTVEDVRVVVGNYVNKGDIVLTFKKNGMKVDIVAPCSGKITSVSVKKYDDINMLDTLITINYNDFELGLIHKEMIEKKQSEKYRWFFLGFVISLFLIPTVVFIINSMCGFSTDLFSIYWDMSTLYGCLWGVITAISVGLYLDKYGKGKISQFLSKFKNN